MTDFVNSFVEGTLSSGLWEQLVVFVPLLAIVVSVGFCLFILNEIFIYFNAKNDPDCLGYYDRFGRYHHFRDPDYYD